MATPNQENRTVTELLNARLRDVAARDDDQYSTSVVEDYCNAVDHVIFNRGYGHSLFRLSYESLPLERVPFRACYRKFHVGFRDQFGKLRTKNDGSDRLFMSYAYKGVGTETVEVSGEFSDAHLIEFCNPGTSSFDVHIVESTRHSIHMSREYLRTAGQRIGIV